MKCKGIKVINSNYGGGGGTGGGGGGGTVPVAGVRG